MNKMTDKINNALNGISEELVDEALYADRLEHNRLRMARNIALGAAGCAAAVGIFAGVMTAGRSGGVDLLPVSSGASASNSGALSEFISLNTDCFTYSQNRSGLTITGYTGTLTDIIIPAEIDGIAVTEIGYQAFAEMTDITSVTLPDTVTEIGIRAFCGCDGLKSVNIPASVRYVGERAFSDCGLTDIEIAEGAAVIGEYMFMDCEDLKEITLPSTVTSIGQEAFAGCDNLSSVTLSEGLIDIGDWAFIACCELKEISIPSSVQSIGYKAFWRIEDIRVAYNGAEYTYDQLEALSQELEEANGSAADRYIDSILPETIPLSPVTEGRAAEVYFGSQFPDIIYATDNLVLFTDNMGKMFLYDFNEERITFTADVRYSIEQVISEPYYDLFGGASWNGLTLTAYSLKYPKDFYDGDYDGMNAAAFGNDVLGCSLFVKEINKTVWFYIDPQTMSMVRLPDQPCDPSPDTVWIDLHGFLCIYPEKSPLFIYPISEYIVPETIDGKSVYIYLHNNGKAYDAVPGKESQLPMISLALTERNGNTTLIEMFDEKGMPLEKSISTIVENTAAKDDIAGAMEILTDNVNLITQLGLGFFPQHLDENGEQIWYYDGTGQGWIAVDSELTPEEMKQLAADTYTGDSLKYWNEFFDTRFMEIDGLLYNYSAEGRGGQHYNEYDFDTLVITEQTANSAVVNIDYMDFYIDPKGKTVTMEFTLALTDSGWRIEMLKRCKLP